MELHELLEHVVVVQDRGLGDLIQAVGAHGTDPGIGLEHDRRNAVELADLADGGRVARGLVIVEILLTVEADQRRGQELFELLRAADSAAGGAAAAVWGGEGLVQVEEAHIKAGVARAGHAKKAIGVRLVISAQAARLVDELGELQHILVVNAGVLGVRDEEGRGVLIDSRLEGLVVGITVLIRVQVDDLEALDVRSRRVGGVGVDRGDDLVALLLLTAGLVVGVYEGRHAQNALGAAAGLERETVHAGDLAHVLAGVIHDLHDALTGAFVLQGVHLAHLREVCELIVDLGAVLHGAGTLADLDVDIGAEGLLRQARVVAQHAGLGDLRQRGGFLALEELGQRVHTFHSLGDLGVSLVDKDAALAVLAQFENDGFVPLCLMETGANLGASIDLFHVLSSPFNPGSRSARRRECRYPPWCGLPSRSTWRTGRARGNHRRDPCRRRCAFRAAPC